MINVLYINFASTNFDGATYSLMDMIKSLQDEVYPIVLLRSKGCVYDYFRENNIECIVCDFEANIIGKPVKWHQYIRFPFRYVFKYLRYYKKNKKCLDYVSNVLKNKDIKIVHTNTSVLSIGYHIAQKIHAKHVWHLREFMDLDFGWIPFTGWSDFKLEISHSDAVIGITQAVLNHYVPNQQSNAYVVFDAVRSRNDSIYLCQKEKYFLFCAGLLSKQKGCDFAIEAFAHSKLFKQGYRLKIIGSCNSKYACQIQKLAEGIGVLDYIDFLGRSDNVKEHMKKATAFLMCSEHEGLGRVSVEAMFYGCLVIGRNSGGTPEFIFDGKTGFLFSNLEECSSAMRKAVSQDNSNIITQAQHFAISNFAIEDYGKKISKIYDEVLNINI